MANGRETDIIRLISARVANSFERLTIMANAIDQIKVVSRQFSDTELAELDKARKMPITYDEDCPETTPEMAMRFRRVNPVRNAMS